MEPSAPPRRSKLDRPRDYYAVLGVPRDASFREMEAAYWRLAGEKRTLLALLNEAYEVLGNAERRLAYNAEREQAPPRERLANRDAERSGLPGLRERLNWHLR